MTVRNDVSSYRQVATLTAPGAASPDGDGGYVQTYAALSPTTWRCAIEKATVASSERNFNSTVIAQSSHILRGRFHAGITTQTRVVWTDRAGTTHTANVLDVADPEGAGVESVVLVSEVVT